MPWAPAVKVAVETASTPDVPAATILLVQLRLSVHAAGPDLVAVRRDGIEHSRWPIIPTDPLAELERLEQAPAPAAAGAHLASLTTLDAALDRQGYRRLTDWAPGPHGPACEVTTSTL